MECSAPTNEASDEDKDDLYQLLIEAVDKEKEKDLVIIMGISMQK